MKMTADQLLKIAGIAPSTTLRTRLNESAGGSRRTVKEAVGSNGVAISAAAHKQLTDMLTWLDARPKGFPDDIFDDEEVGVALDKICAKGTGSDDFGSPSLKGGKLICYSHETDKRVTLVAKSGGSVKESMGGGKLIHLFTSAEDSDFARTEFNDVDDFITRSGNEIDEYVDLFEDEYNYSVLRSIDAEDVAKNVIVRGSSDPYAAEQARKFEAAANEINSMVARNRDLVILRYGFEYDDQYLVLTRGQLAELKAAASGE